MRITTSVLEMVLQEWSKRLKTISCHVIMCMCTIIFAVVSAQTYNCTHTHARTHAEAGAEAQAQAQAEAQAQVLALT